MLQTVISDARGLVAMFQFTALAGAQSASRASQSLLELDGGVKILVDAGWDSRFDTRQLAELEKHVSTLSFILLTHATISHLGAYAHCCKHIPLFSQVPVYATVPVIDLGRTTIQDLYSSSPVAATFIPATASPEDQTASDDTIRSRILREAPTAQEIQEYFAAITPLKYSQPIQPKPSYFSAPLEGLTLTAYNAGHTLGGTIWHIQQGMESIVYAVDWHQGRENVIAGAAWFEGGGGAEVSEMFRNPTALICSSVNGDKIALSGGRKARDETLLKHIRSSVEKGGSVLIPTDSSARILELTYLLEKTWQERASDPVLKKAKIYMATGSGNATLKHARSLLEWMDESVERFDADEDNKETTAKTHKRSGSKRANGIAKTIRPFEFRHVKVIETRKRLEKVLDTEAPKIIIASDLSLEWGLSRITLERIGSKAENLVVLTESDTAGSSKQRSAASTLSQWHLERLNGVSIDKTPEGDQIEQVLTGKELVLHEARKEPLDDSETLKYQQYVATQQQMRTSLITADGRQLADAEEAMEGEDDSSDESEDEGDEQQGRVLNVSAALTHGSKNKAAVSDEDLGVSILLRKKDVFDFDVRSKKGRNAVFPYAHSRRRGDEFGDFIKPEDFLRDEEREAQLASHDDKSHSVLGQKRKWADDNRQIVKSGKKQKQELALPNGGGEDSSSEESDSDAEEAVDDSKSAQQATGPSKVVYEERRIDFRAKIALVDFAGLHDQRSLQMLIPLINPKKLVLIGGSQSETTALANDCKELLNIKIDGQAQRSGAEIYLPQIGDTIDASVDTNAWTVKLTRELVKRLQWQNVKQLSIVTVTGQLKMKEDAGQNRSETASKKLKLESQESEVKEEVSKKQNPAQPILDAMPANAAAAIRAVNHSIHVGDLKIRQLQSMFTNSGHSAVLMMGGTLVVDGIVAVRKLPNGQVIVEGPPLKAKFGASADSFTAVKRMIYDGLAVVAG